MIKFGKGMLMALTVLIIGGTVPTSASASHWHKGSPKALRGKFQYKRQSTAEGFGAMYEVTKWHVEIGISNMPSQTISRLRYKKIGSHLYRLKGHVAKNGLVHAANVDFAVYRKGKTFASIDYGYHKKHGFTKGSYARQVKHFKSGGPVIK